MPHTSRVSVVTDDGIFYCSRKVADWLVSEGRAAWRGAGRIVVIGEAREWRSKMSGGYAAMQLAPLRDRRR